MRFLNDIYIWLQTLEGIGPKTKIKGNTKLPLEMWSQKLARMASFGLRIRYSL